jgi:Ni/Fe-hydrogenase 1 B-type cytochrome subunit
MMSTLFRSRHSVSLRLWHWLSSLAIIALLSTVLLASTILKPMNNVKRIQDKLEEKGVKVSADQAKALAKNLGNDIWVWHTYLGVALAVLLFFRIVTEFFEPQGQSLRARIRKGALYLHENGTDKKEAKHYLFVKYIYLFFYLCVSVMVCTGLCLIYADAISWLKAAEETIKNIHSFTMYLILAFIILHIGGILRSELGADQGIVSDMINGGNTGEGYK